jgi:hypothetical protein
MAKAGPSASNPCALLGVGRIVHIPLTELLLSVISPMIVRESTPGPDIAATGDQYSQSSLHTSCAHKERDGTYAAPVRQ